MNGSYGIFLIIVLVLVSGLIAYVGDILGRRLGRRRITLFGLRPRYTAIVISVVAGMLITLFTLITAATISEKVRDGLMRVDAIRSQLAKLETSLEDKTEKLSTAEARMTEAEKARETALAQLGQANAQMASVNEKLQTAEGDLASAAEELEQVTTRLAVSQGRLEQVEGQLAEVKKELAEEEAKAKKAAESALSAGRKVLELERRQKELDKQRQELSKEMEELERQTASLRSEREYLRAEIVRLSALVGVTAPILTEEVIYDVGEELGREIILANQSISAIKGELEQFISRLDRLANKAGAGTDEEGRSVFLLRAMLIEGPNMGARYDESNLIEILARQIQGPSGSVVVRAFSMLNVPRGRLAPVDLVLVPNRLLFKRGEELASTTLDPQKREGELLLETAAWLRSEVGARGRQAQILPDLVGAGGTALIFGGGRYAVGRIGPDSLFALLREVKRKRDPVRVVARAAKDTWTAGPLEIELNIEKSPDRQ